MKQSFKSLLTNSTHAKVGIQLTEILFASSECRVFDWNSMQKGRFLFTCKLDFLVKCIYNVLDYSNTKVWFESVVIVV